MYTETPKTLVLRSLSWLSSPMALENTGSYSLLPSFLHSPPTIFGGVEMHSDHQAPRQRTLPDLLQLGSLLWLCVDAWDHAGIEEAG